MENKYLFIYKGWDLESCTKPVECTHKYSQTFWIFKIGKRGRKDVYSGLAYGGNPVVATDAMIGE